MKTYKIIFINGKTGLTQGTTIKALDKSDAISTLKSIFIVSEIIEIWEA